MPLRFNTLLAQADIDPADVRLLRHQDNRAERGRTPFELWRDNRPRFETYQSTQTIKNGAKLSSKYWASFVVPPNGETLLAGLYRIGDRSVNDADLPWPHATGSDPAGTCHVYKINPDNRLDEFAGRLVIDWGEGAKAWIQRADKQDKEILHIRDRFKDPDFPGFTRFLATLSKIGSLPENWRSALASCRGIYLLTCPKTREQYVGSATGDGGFYNRWLAYAHDGHGGNIGLKSRDPSDYQVSILEVAGSASTREEILGMEILWKQKLQSREMGLNRN